MNLTIVHVTARAEPRIMWFLKSLMHQLHAEDKITVVSVNFFTDGLHVRDEQWHPQILVRFTRPKPTVWQGPERITKDHWWAMSNARNTGLCLCRDEWIAFLDDRCVLRPHWLDSIRLAMANHYAVFGSYEKRWGMEVTDGFITKEGELKGIDCRLPVVKDHRDNQDVVKCTGDWAFGCTLALPLEWALHVNGYDEVCDGLSMEDVIFGIMLQNNGFDLRFDRRMAVVQDRTPDRLGLAMVRKDKGVSPQDKSHALLKRMSLLRHASHPFIIRELRNRVLQGAPWPPPWGPVFDWFDQQRVDQM